MAHEIAIIGGGYTGMVAAYRLSCKTKCRITIFEASPELGGLAADFKIHNQALEKTYHHLFRSDTDILELFEELGIGSSMQWLNSSVSILINGETYPFVSVLDVLKFKPIPFPSRIRFGLSMLLLKRKKDWSNLKQVLALDWVKKFCGRSASTAIWEPLLRGKFDKYAESVSMAWLWARVHIRANSRTSIFEKERLGYPKGGFAIFTDTLANKLKERGISIQTNTRINQVLPSSDNGVQISVNGNSKRFDACIFTGSSRAFQKILPATGDLSAYTDSLSKIPYLSAICLAFSTDQILGESYWLNINEPDAPFLVFIRHTRMVPAKDYQGHQVYYIGAYRSENHPQLAMSDNDLKRTWYSYIKKLFPEFDTGKILEEHLFRFRDAQHVVDTSYTEKIPSYQTPIKGLYLANFSQIFPEDRGTNYAVREGNKIALKVASDYKLQ